MIQFAFRSSKKFLENDDLIQIKQKALWQDQRLKLFPMRNERLTKNDNVAVFRPAPFFDANLAVELCNPLNYGGNNKSEWIKKLAGAAAIILCEIETIQAIKGDGILK